MRLFTCLVLWCWINLSFAQVQINGVINIYFQVSEIEATDCETLFEVVVTDTPPNPPFYALIIQMNGAALTLDDSPAFGHVLDYRGAGRQERIRIERIEGQQWVCNQALKFDYQTEYAVQLIPIPQYESVRVSADLSAGPWDGQTGGVLTLEVADTLFLDASIDVRDGFRGGSAQTNLPNNCSWLINQQGYAYPSDSWRGAPKGEGIGRPEMDLLNGRGATSNGGGGGNDHNSSGGGGSHLSGGGQGGANDEPSTFGCDGDFPGLGGWALDGELGSRWFMGGGGGAGHQNNDAGSGGGSGGGIVYLQTAVLISQGNTISVAGRDAPDAPQTDGAGGGGAGGTLILLADEVVGDLQLDVSGGSGGRVQNLNANRCMAGGGGGSGGVLYTNLDLTSFPQIVFQKSGGNPGPAVNTPVCPGALNGAEAGKPGGSFPFEELITSNPTASVSNTIVLNKPLSIQMCEQSDTLLSVVVDQPLPEVLWYLDAGNGLETWLSDTLVASGSLFEQSISLTYLSAWPDTVWVQAALVDACLDTLWSVPDTLIRVGSLSIDADIIANGLEFTLINTSVNAQSVEWWFEDGMVFETDTLIRSDLPAGIYEIRQVVANACDTLEQWLTLVLSEAPPVAAFSAQSVIGCVPLEVQFTNQSSGTVLLQNWSFPGGIPDESTEANPIITYSSPGIYAVTLEVSDVYTSNALTLVDYVEVLEKPTADFSLIQKGDTVFFDNQSVSASQYQWGFGDGTAIDTSTSPIHVYSSSGTFTVTLTAGNEYCDHTVSQQVDILLTSVSGDLMNTEVALFPNPSRNWITVEVPKDWQPCSMHLYDARGRTVGSVIIHQARQRIDLSRYPAGMYWFQIDGQLIGRVVLLSD